MWKNGVCKITWAMVHPKRAEPHPKSELLRAGKSTGNRKVSWTKYGSLRKTSCLKGIGGTLESRGVP